MTAISVSERLLEMAAFYTPLALTVTNKRSGQCDYERKSKHSKCSYTCEKRRGLTGISLQSSKQIR